MKNSKTIMPNFNFPGQTIPYQESIAEFASRWKRAFSPESIAQGKATAKSTAIDKKGVTKGILPMNQAYTDLESRVNKGQKLSVSGKQAMLTKAASPNRTMRPTTQRGGLKVARSGNKQLTPKSAQSFKQGAQNQAINAKNTRLRNATNSLKSNAQLRGDLEGALNPPKPFNPNKSSFVKNANKGINMKPKDVSGELGSISTKKPGLLSRIGGAIRRNPVAAGAGLGAVGAGIGYGIYKNRKQNK